MNNIDAVMPIKGEIFDTRDPYFALAIDAVREVFDRTGAFVGHDVLTRRAHASATSVNVTRETFLFADGRFKRWNRSNAMQSIRTKAERAVAAHIARAKQES